MNPPPSKTFFSSLRGKLTLSYTLVTVLALLSLELLALIGVLVLVIKESNNRQQYIADVHAVLSSQARRYLTPGQEDLEGLQEWLGSIFTSRSASLPPEGLLDSPEALIDPTASMVVTRPGGFELLACIPKGCTDYHSGISSTPYAKLDSAIDWSQDWANSSFLEALTLQVEGGKSQLAVPITTQDRNRILGVIYLTIEPAPLSPMLWPALNYGFMFLISSGLLLILAIIPFGILFGFVISRGLTQRLSGLERLAQTYGEGNFDAQPEDREPDEIGRLGERLRQMADHIQHLLQAQQELAAVQERTRLARDLHDAVKQSIFAALMQIRASRNRLAEQDAAVFNLAVDKHLAEAEKLVSASQQELNLLITELRTSANPPVGSVQAVVRDDY
jgi:two-component system, NarL family, sensor histidine kinase LiaS